jgi:hypothetical protein
MEGLTEGRVVHYVMDRGRYQGEHRPATVVKVWRGADGQAQANGVCQLQVLYDGTNDIPDAVGAHMFWATSVIYADPAENKPGSWHWPERA